MIRVEVREQVNAEWWDEHIDRTVWGSVYQTASWADFYRTYTDGRPWYLLAYEGEEVVGLLLAFESIVWPGPFADGGPLVWLRPLAKAVLTGLVWSHGPVIWREAQRIDILSAFLVAVNDLAKKRGLLCAEKVSSPIGYDDPEVVATFHRAGFSAKQWATYVVDLTQPGERLWKNLKGNGATRTPIRKAQHQGVTVRLAVNQDDLRQYYEIMGEHARINGLYRTQYARWTTMADVLGHQMRVFLAERDGRVIAGAGVVLYNGLMHLVRPVQSAYCYEQRVYAGDLLQWAIIKWGHEHGMMRYDLAGVSPAPVDAKERGIAEFKAKWGGTYVEYYEYHRVYHEMAYRVMNLARSLLARVLKRVGRQI